MCVCANRKIEVKFTVDCSLIHYAECVLNYVKRRAHETGDLRGKVTIRGGDQGGRSAGDGVFWPMRSRLTLNGSLQSLQTLESVIWPTCGPGLALDCGPSRHFYTLFVLPGSRPPCLGFIPHALLSGLSNLNRRFTNRNMLFNLQKGWNEGRAVLPPINSGKKATGAVKEER